MKKVKKDNCDLFEKLKMVQQQSKGKSLKDVVYRDIAPFIKAELRISRKPINNKRFSSN